MQELQASLNRFLPELVISAGLLLVVVVDSIGAAWRNALNRGLTVASLLAAIAFCKPLAAAGYSGTLFSGMLVLDPLAVFFKLILLGASLLVVLSFTFRNSRELA